MGRSSVMLLTYTCGCKLAFWLIGPTYVLHYRSVCLIGIRAGLRRRGGGALNIITLQEEKDLLAPG